MSVQGQAEQNNDGRLPALGSLCIATYRRPEMLSDLLRSLQQQHLPPDLELECIVVDNDPAGSARAVCERFAADMLIDYSIQPQKNISLTRNQAVARARGQWLFFIDDDEVANPVWAKSLYETALATDADGVTGHLQPAFDPNAPAWLTETRFFHRDVPPTGTPFLFTGIGNCVIRSSCLEDVPGPFSEQYGLTGGEDTWLLRGLHQRGAKLVACREAVVTEHVPPARANPDYLLDRARRTGALYTYMAVRLKPAPRWLTAVWLGAKAALLWLVFGLRKGLLRWSKNSNPAQTLRLSLRQAAYAGHVDGLQGRISDGY